MKQMRHRRGQLQLVVIAGAAALAACSPMEDNTPPESLSRPYYSNLAECRQDWDRDELCEQSAPNSSGSTVHYGPYYSGHRGYYYDYDGTRRALVRTPSFASGHVESSLTPRQVTSMPGRYASTHAAAHASSSHGSISRGGFGGRAGGSGGG